MLSLICLFTTEESLDHTSSMIVKTYEVIYKRIFVLSIQDSEELVCSFNVDKENQKKQLPTLHPQLRFGVEELGVLPSKSLLKFVPIEKFP